MKPKRIILAGGTGFLGRLLAKALTDRGDEVVLLTRHPSNSDTHAKAVYWDGRTQGPWAAELEGADVLINLAVGKFGSQAIRSTFDMGWHPTHFIPNSSLSIAAFLDPAGVENAVGIISNARSKGTAAAQPGDDGAVRDYLEWMRKYNPDASLRDQINVAGYERAATLVEVLRKCGDDLTRANVMKQAASLDFDLGLLRPGIRITTSPTDYQPIKQLYLVKFNGKAWVPVGAVVGS